MTLRINDIRCTLVCLVTAILILSTPSFAQPCNPEIIEQLVAGGNVGSGGLGKSVAISGDVAAVGAHGDSSGGVLAGSVTVYRFDGTDWIWEARLTAKDAAPEKVFGYSVAIHGEVIIVGAHGDKVNGEHSGSSYIFRYINGEWSQEAKLIPFDGTEEEFFGYSVSVFDNLAVVGAREDADVGERAGSAYVYRFDGESWNFEGKLLPSSGVYRIWFGSSVAASENTILVGAPLDGENGGRAGAASVFRFNGDNWYRETKLLATERAGSEQMGTSVSISGNTAILGAPRSSANGTASGAAYIFHHNGESWSQAAKLIPMDGERDGHFGESVSISGDTCLVGALGSSDNGTGSGSAYIFRFDETNWTQTAKMLAENGQAHEEFGTSVSIFGGTAVVGAPRATDNGAPLGTAYIFDVNCTTNCLADVNGDGMLTPTDFTAWINAFNNQLAECDQNGDGSCTPTDFTAWIANFNAGC